MSDAMICAKAVVDWIPTGSRYKYEFSKDVKNQRVCHSFFLNLSKISGKWMFRSRQGVEEELFYDDHIVVWCKNSEIADSFPLLALDSSSRIISCSWSSFFLPSDHIDISQNQVADRIKGKTQRGISVFEAERLTFVDDCGEQYTTRLPCRIAAAWSLPSVTLIERSATDSTQLTTSNSSDNFTIFSVLHPLDEVAPVILKVPLSSSNWAVSFANDINLHILAVLPDLSLILTRHFLTGIHSWWKLELASPQDYVSLYNIGDDGRAYVAPHSLTGFLLSTSSPGQLVNTPIGVVRSPLPLNASTTIMTPLRVDAATSFSKSTCLSPFAASLARVLRTEEEDDEPRPNDQSSLLSTTTATAVNRVRLNSLTFNSPMVKRAFTPRNIRDHINRLSSLTPNGGRWAGRSSGAGATSLGQTLLIGAGGSLVRDCGGDASIKQIAIPATVDDLVSEPLLPKFCMRLIWTEKGREVSNQPQPPPSTPHHHPATPIHRTTTPTVSLRLAANQTPGSGLLTSPFLSKQTPFKQPFSPGPAPNVQNQQPAIGLNSEGSTNSTLATFGPVKLKAFLASDLAGADWICFLVPSPPRSSTGALACIDANDFVHLPSNGSSNQQPTYLAARDAAYVAASRMTVCLDAFSVGIVLYSGVKKLCIVGVSPSILHNPSSALNGGRQSNKLIDSHDHNTPFPFVIRPTTGKDVFSSSASEINQIVQRMQLLARRCVAAIDSTSSHPLAVSDQHRPASPTIFTTAATSPIDTKYQIDTQPLVQPFATSQSLFSISQATSDSFLLAVKQQQPDDSRHGDDDADSDRFYRVYLPSLTSDEYIEKCLAALLHGTLPRHITMHLLSQWYVTNNVVGASAAGHMSTASLDDPLIVRDPFPTLNSSHEWDRFVEFLLASAGLSLASGGMDESDVSMIVSDSDESGQPGLPKSKRSRDSSFDRSPASIDKKDRLLMNSCPTVILINGAKFNQDCRAVFENLPTILLTFHLVYEESKLNILSESGRSRLARLNMTLARILHLEHFLRYYAIELDFADAGNQFPYFDLPLLTLNWPSLWDMKAHCPDLLAWFNSRLLMDKCQPNECCYLHLPMVNDLAVSMAALLLLLLQEPRAPFKDVHEIETALDKLWTPFIKLLASTSDRSLQARLKILPNSPSFDLQIINRDQLSDTLVDRLTSRMGPLAVAFADALLNSSLYRARDQPTNLALLFLSTIDASGSGSGNDDWLTQRLTLLPPELGALVQLVCCQCRDQPPPNCAAPIYRLIGRTDLAQLTQLSNGDDSSSMSLSSATSASKSSINAQPQSKWSVTERWSAKVNRPNAQLLQSAESHVSTYNRHPLLSYLELGPACYISFKDDLRLREAYRLLQTQTCIHIPRISSIAEARSQAASNTGPGSNTFYLDQATRQSTVRIHMHLSAACVRACALSVGRGMLGLNSALGKGIPFELRVTPLCLRGQFTSPDTGRPVYIDLSYDSHAIAPAANADNNNQAGGINDQVGWPHNQIVDTADPSTSSSSSGNSVATDQPFSAIAFSTACVVASSGVGAALRTASLDLNRMAQRYNHPAQSTNLSAIATNSTNSAVSLLSTSNLQSSSAVLSTRQWPAFHNGVAVGLTVSPKATVDSTWLMYNFRSADRSSTNQKPSPEQAGLLLGLGLNGHLNKLSPYDIGEFTVRVNEMHNMAVLLGLCAGKRGTMDLNILRLLAVHYRPLLPRDPVLPATTTSTDLGFTSSSSASTTSSLTVPPLCQAAAVFGLGLLYQGSAHRHTTSLLIAELGRSLSDSDSPATSDASIQATNTGAGANSGGGVSELPWTNGMAGDSAELIALSSGLALGLVLLGRGTTQCGLSDLAWTETLHDYMTGAVRRDLGKHHRPIPRRNRLQTTSSTTSSNKLGRPSAVATSIRDGDNDQASSSASTLLPSPHHDPTSQDDTTSSLNHLLTLSQSGGNRRGGRGGSLGTPSAPSQQSINSDVLVPINDEHEIVFSRLKVLDASGRNPQIRDLNTYNIDVSAPGAIMALGMAYFGTNNPTVSRWLQPPPTTNPSQMELARVDLLLLSAIAYGLVNFYSIQPSQDWLLTGLAFGHQTHNQWAAAGRQPAHDNDVENLCPGTGLLPATTDIGRLRLDDDAAVFGIKNAWASVDMEMIQTAYLNIIVGNAFAMGLRYAGTSHPAAATVLYNLVQSLRSSSSNHNSWWPTHLTDPYITRRLVKLPRATIDIATAHCLLALALVIAGSGNLSVLRLVRQLRAIRLFRTNQPRMPASGSSTSRRLHTVASLTAKAVANAQGYITPQSATGNNNNGTAVAPVTGVSVGAVFGAALCKPYGLQMVYANIVGLLFLGGGQLTLSNSPEAVAMLSIAFLPILPSSPGDNWYHLQALRHLYVLAVTRRRACVVDVDSSLVVQASMQAKIKSTNELVESQGTLVIPSDGFDDLAWIKINHDSDTYWPTTLVPGTSNWEQFKIAFNETGYIYAKRRDSSDQGVLSEFWLRQCDEFAQTHDLRLLRRLSMVCRLFGRLSPDSRDEKKRRRQSNWTASANALRTRINRVFLTSLPELSQQIQAYYFGPDAINCDQLQATSQPSSIKRLLLCALFWYRFPTSPDALRSALTCFANSKPSMQEFAEALQPVCPTHSMLDRLWMFKILFRDQPSFAIRAIQRLLTTLYDEIDNHPLIEEPQRFGNRAFKSWHSWLVGAADKLCSSLVQTTNVDVDADSLTEIAGYLTESFGNPTRIDYGTGHELTFLCFLICLLRVGFLSRSSSESPDDDLANLALAVMPVYLKLVRRLQLHYRMEPAGSQGVWCLDDFQFVPYIWGSSQLLDSQTLRPEMIPDRAVAEANKDTNLLFSCIDFIFQAKTGPFGEHSSTLHSISRVATWRKVHTGMGQMYKAEVLGKFPVVQHFLFGRLLRLTPPLVSSTDGGDSSDGFKRPS